MGKLYLIPNLLGDTEVCDVIPNHAAEIIKKIKVFATEDIRNTRRYLKKIDKSIIIDDLTFLEMNQQTERSDIESYVKYLKDSDVGIISEAGCPGIADPGAELVALAHKFSYEVVPLVGPSSILLALIASGFNGQTFSFNGYLPINKSERIKSLKHYEKQSALENRTQIFIETPYRNTALLDDMINNLSPNTFLCIACDITTSGEFIKSKQISDWKKNKPDIHKKPCIFVLYSGNLKK